MRNLKLLLAAFGLTALPLAAAPAVAQTDLSPQPSGDWTHPQTGTVFPVALAGFERMPIKVFEDREMYSIAYSLIDNDLVMTVNFYVYPTRGESCADQTAKVANQTRMVDGSKLVSQGRAPSPSGRTANAGSFWRHTLPAGTIPGMGELWTDSYLFCSSDGKWFVSYRGTWEGDTSAADRVTTLFRSFRWPAPLQ